MNMTDGGGATEDRWMTDATRDLAAAVGPDARAEQARSWNERDPQIPQSRWWLSDAPFVGVRIVRDP